MENYIIKILEYIKDPSHFPATFLAPFFLLIISILLKIPQRLFKMILDRIVEYKANKVSNNFLSYLVNIMKLRSTDELMVRSGDLEKVYFKSWLTKIFPEIYEKVRNKCFIILSRKRLRKMNETIFLFIKSDNLDLFEEKDNATT